MIQGTAAPAFTVVTPLYNKRTFIRDTITSALAQDYPAFEIVVVDDSSTDGSADAIADLLGEKLRIVRQDNAGPGAARNRGIAEARFDWIAFLDADDLWYPDHLSELARIVAAEPDAELIATGFYRTKQSAIPLQPAGAGAIEAIDFFKTAATSSPIWTSAAAARRRVFADLGGFKNFRPGQDTDMWVRIALERPIAVSSRITAIYRLGTGGITSTAEKQRRKKGVGAGLKQASWRKILDGALTDPRHAEKRDSIRAFLDGRAMIGAKNAIVGGNTPRARAMLDTVTNKRSARYWCYRALSFVPRRAMKPVLALSTMLRPAARV